MVAPVEEAAAISAPAPQISSIVAPPQPAISMSLPMTTSTTDPPQQAVATGTLYIILGRLKDYAGNVMKERKPWAEALDRNSFAKPQNLTEATSRLRKNVERYKVNYLLVIISIFAVWMVLHPSSLLVLSALLVAWLYVFVIRTTPLTISGRTLSEREKLLAMSAISLLTVFMSSVGTVIFSALALSAVVIALHGAMHVRDDLFVDSAESNQGFFAVFTTPAAVTGPGIV